MSCVSCVHEERDPAKAPAKAKPPAVKEAAPQPPKFDGKIGSRKFRKANPTASFGQESISGLDLHKAADLLAGVEFTFPTQAEKLWRESDGLPAPDDGQFARKASRFLAAHPIPPPNEKIAVWEIPDVSSRQCKCLAYLASGKKEGRGKVANLCVAQAVRLLWMLPPRTWRGRKNIVDRAFYAATGSLCMTGTLLRRQAEDGSVLYEVGTQWLRTGLGQFVTYGDRGDQTLRKAAEALIGDAIADTKIRDLHGTDDEFFSQIDLTRPDMREVARCVADGDFEQAKLAYVDVLAVRFSGKRDRPKPPTKKKAVDTHIADDICRNIFIITCHMHIRADFGKEVDWSRVFNNDIESRVWMNCHPWMNTLMSAYRKTGNEKYVTHLCRLFNSWYNTSPPTFERSQAQWRTHEVSARPDRYWPAILTGLADHPTFKRESLFNIARSMLDHGIYAYKHDEFEPYWRGSWSHNTIVIDGLSQHRALGPQEKMPDPDRRFVIGDGFDFAVGWYKRAYSPRTQAWISKSRNNYAEDRAAAIRNVQHQRCIFYVKGEYAIVCDRVLGEGEHQVDILFHPAPIVTRKGSEHVVRAVDLEVKPNGVVVTKESKHANVAIIPAQGESLEVLDLIGQKNPVRGWYALYGIQPSHDIVYRCNRELPRHFETVVQPLPAGKAEPVGVESLLVESVDGKTCAALKYGDDLLLISYDGPAEMTCGDVRYHGTALLLQPQRETDGRPSCAHMVDGTLLSIDGKEVFSANVPAAAHSLALSKGGEL